MYAIRSYYVIEYSEREFIYPELYKKITEYGTISKQTLLDAIRHYEEIQNEKVI